MTLEEARGRAARIWCLPQFADREMDAGFAEAIAQAIREAEAEMKERCVMALEERQKFTTQAGANALADAAAAIRALPDE